jgi:hypothetical protein
MTAAPATCRQGEPRRRDPGDLRLVALLLPTTLTTFSGGSATGPVMSTILAYFGPGQPLYLLFFAR